MPATAMNLISRVSLLLGDPNFVRWPEAELLDWLNDGVRAICVLKPNASAETRTIPLVAGTVQRLPATVARMLRVLFSIGDSDVTEPLASPRAVNIVDRHALDAAFPQWMNPAVVPFQPHVEDLAWDQSDPKAFFVSPGNDGTGALRAIVSVIPAPLASVTAEIPIPDEYANALIEYVAFRAFGKDTNLPGAAQAAAGHLALFGAAIGETLTAEQLAAVATTRQTPKP